MDRVSETQLQVSENLDWILWRLKGYLAMLYKPKSDKHDYLPKVTVKVSNHNRKFFAYFSVNSQQIFEKFHENFFQ